MSELVAHSADDILAMTSEELKKLRPSFFKEMRQGARSKEKNEAFMEFISRYSIVQEMRDWSRLAEPGIAGIMIGEDDFSEQDIEDAREMDRNSLEVHSELVDEFEKRGGRAAFQAAIDRLNALTG